MDNRPQTRVDHVTTWAVAVIVAGFGAISLAAVVASVPPAPEGTYRHGFPGLAIFQGIAALYAAAAILQLEYGFIRSWRPRWGQGLGLVWFGGWTLLMLAGLVSQFLAGGAHAAREFFGGAAVVLGLLVVLPWVIATLRALSRSERYEGFIR
jgi:hypothetical protein